MSASSRGTTGSAIPLWLGGKPSKGTPKDKRLKENKQPKQPKKGKS